MFYVITNYGVKTGKTLNEVNNKLGTKIEESELTYLGSDAVTNVSPADIDFLQDKRRMSQIMFSNFFKKDSSVKFLVIMNLAFTALVFFLK